MDSLRDIYQEHQHLLETIEQPRAESVIPEVKQFLERIGKMGAVIIDPRQRSRLRSLMRFWGSFVYDRTGEFPEIPLLPPTIEVEQIQAQTGGALPAPTQEEESVTLYEGMRFGIYELLEEIGEGGFSTVYKALDTQTNKIVALKILYDKQFRKKTEMFRQQLIAQERLVSNLEHPNIIPVYAVGDNQGIPYISMKYVQRGSLADLLYESYWKPTIREMLKIVLQVLEATAYLHSQGIVHRDIKPANILIDFDNTVYLTDFGIAQVLESVFGGMIVGTPEYLAPEAILHPEKVDGSADVYSIGVILFYLLEGILPFRGDTPEEVLYKHVNEETPDLSKDVPEPLRELVLACLAKDPSVRPGVVELQEKMEYLLLSLPGEVLNSQIRHFTSSPESRRKEHTTTTMMQPPVSPPPPSVAHSETMACPQCGAVTTPGEVFCEMCGASLLKEQEPQGERNVPSSPSPPQVLEGIYPVKERVVGILIARDGSKYYVMNRERVTIGRSPLNDIVIDDPSVSMHHALVVYRSGKDQSPCFTIFDLASTNGTLVNGKVCIKRRLKHNDVITFGNVELIFKRLDK